MKSGVRVVVVWLAVLVGCSLVVDHDTDFLPVESLTGGTQSSVVCRSDDVTEVGADCSDGCDNDGDGAIDCDDTECICAETETDCADQVDNDSNGLLDCDDSACAGTQACYRPPPPEGICTGGEGDLDCCRAGGEQRCCENGLDDDGNGLTDCQESACDRSEHCCGGQVEPVTEPGTADGGTPGFDSELWLHFSRSAEPRWNESTLRIDDWRDGGAIGGVTLREPVDVAYGVNFSFHVALPHETSHDGGGCGRPPWEATGFAGLALAPRQGPQRDNEPPRPVLSVLVTADRHLMVVRGTPALSRTLLCLGLDQLPPEEETLGVEIALVPDFNDFGEVGYRLELFLVGTTGREVCGEDGSFKGCREVSHWESPELVLYGDSGEDRLLTGRRGLFLMVVGSGAGVELSDRTGKTITVRPRQCANPSAWSVASDAPSLAGSSLCWAVGALGSPAVTRLPSQQYAMAVEGSTREVPPSGYGISRYSLGWLTSSDAPHLNQWQPNPASSYDVDMRYRPMDTPFDHNCQGWTEWPLADCRGDGDVLGSPPGGCKEQVSRRAPHIIAGAPTQEILFARAMTDQPAWYELGAATFNPSLLSWTPALGEVALVPGDVAGVAYRSFRDPVSVCHPDEGMTDDSCLTGRHIVLFVGERQSPGADGNGPSGDDLLTVPYQIGRGFQANQAEQVISGQGDHPLAGQVLSEPALVWDPTVTADAPSGRLYLWLTVRSSGGTAQVELYRFEPEPDMTAADFSLARGQWLSYVGNPVLTAQDFEQLWRDAGQLIDCSGRCDLGGVTALLVPDGDTRSQLHLWVSLVERPAANDETARHSIVHLHQPWAPEYGGDAFL